MPKGGKIRAPMRSPDEPLILALIRLRLEQHLSQRALADLADVSISLVGRWERGTGKPDFDSLQLWAKALGYRLRLEPLP